MPRKIHILPDSLVNRIAAGEVVERPASVVRELVENALDAGATRVEVALRNGGKTEVRVADDGCGMGREDALLCLDRHATSKLGASADLLVIRSLGFRGEALPAIASVSRLTLETAEECGEGTRVVVNGGRIASADPAARRRGSTVAVRSLFFNVPARAKFLRSAAVETRAVGEALAALALAHPGVAFRLLSNGRVLLDAEPDASLPERVTALWGAEAARGMISVALHRDGFAVTGLVQRPRNATAGARRSHLFVNGRVFADRALVRAVDRGYRTTVARGIRPAHLLSLHLPDGAVDVNVHPAKAEVRFRDPAYIEGLVEEAVRSALATAASAAPLGPGEGSAEIAFPAHQPQPATVREPRDAPAGPPGERQMSLFVAHAPAPEAAAVPPPAATITLWQLHDTYILAETRAGLVLVDQHSAHERVLYEELMRTFDSGAATSQRLLFPLTLRLGPAEYGLVEEIAGVLNRAGWEIEPFGAGTALVHATPQPHAGFDAERCLREMLGELVNGSPLVDPARTRHEKVALSFACKAAIKAGQPLAPPEMAELFDRLFATELPYHDIHGRPTVVQLSLAELHRRFGRSA